MLHSLWTTRGVGDPGGCIDPEVYEPSHIRPQPPCPSSWEPGRTVRSPKKRVLPSLLSEWYQLSPTQTGLCFCRGPRDRTPKGVEPEDLSEGRAGKCLEQGVTAQRSARYLG